MQAVLLENVCKAFATTKAVDELSLAVPVGSVYGFIGPNGSGKTTTLRMIMRILHPDTGRVAVLGRDHHGPANDEIGYLPEERGLYKKMKVGDLLRFYSALKSYHPPQSELVGWLDRMNLGGRLNDRVESLSKGMSQKLQFISAVIARPQLLLLDEPFSGLDPVNAVVLREAVLELVRGGTTVIFSTHDMAVAERMCDFIFMIYKGKKVLDGTLEDIQRSYGADTVRVRVIPRDTHPAHPAHADAAANGLLDNLPGVSKVTDFGNNQELRIDRGTDTDAILAELLRRGRVAQFEVTPPSLQDIFVRIAAPDILGDAAEPTRGEAVLA